MRVRAGRRGGLECRTEHFKNILSLNSEEKRGGTKSLTGFIFLTSTEALTRRESVHSVCSAAAFHAHILLLC